MKVFKQKPKKLEFILEEGVSFDELPAKQACIILQVFHKVLTHLSVTLNIAEGMQSQNYPEFIRKFIALEKEEQIIYLTAGFYSCWQWQDVEALSELLPPNKHGVKRSRLELQGKDIEAIMKHTIIFHFNFLRHKGFFWQPLNMEGFIAPALDLEEAKNNKSFKDYLEALFLKYFKKG